MKGLIWLKYSEDGNLKSSVDKFFDEAALKQWVDLFKAKPGDLVLVLAGDLDLTLKALSELRLEMGTRLELRDPDVFKPLWVVDFPRFQRHRCLTPSENKKHAIVIDFMDPYKYLSSHSRKRAQLYKSEPSFIINYI